MMRQWREMWDDCCLAQKNRIFYLWRLIQITKNILLEINLLQRYICESDDGHLEGRSLFPPQVHTTRPLELAVSSLASILRRMHEEEEEEAAAQSNWIQNVAFYCRSPPSIATLKWQPCQKMKWCEGDPPLESWWKYLQYQWDNCRNRNHIK